MMGGLSGEREPKGAESVDERGERRSGGAEKKPVAESGEREPKGAKASDSSGEKGVGLKNGIGMGMKDECGRSGAGSAEKGELNTGRKEGHFHSHQRAPGSKY